MRQELKKNVHVEVLVPIRIECLLDDTCCMRLFGINGDYREGIGQPEDIPLGQTVGRNNFPEVLVLLRHLNDDT